MLTDTWILNSKFENEVKVGLSGGSNLYSIVLEHDIMKRNFIRLPELSAGQQLRQPLCTPRWASPPEDISRWILQNRNSLTFKKEAQSLEFDELWGVTLTPDFDLVSSSREMQIPGG